jgi:hypothetical protein
VAAAAASMTAPVERALPLTADDWEALRRRIAEIEREREDIGAPASPPSSWDEDAWKLAAQVGPSPGDEYQLWELQLLHRRHMKERERRREGYKRRHLGRLKPPPKFGRDPQNVNEAEWLLKQDFITERMASIPQSSTRSRGADVPLVARAPRTPPRPLPDYPRGPCSGRDVQPVRVTV